MTQKNKSKIDQLLDKLKCTDVRDQSNPDRIRMISEYLKNRHEKKDK